MSQVPRHVARRTSLQTPTFWVDESGARGSAGKGYVVAALKTRPPDLLARRIHTIREKHSWTGEFKFAKISERNTERFLDLASVLEKSDVHVVASVVQHDYNPFKTMASWQAQAEIVSRLIIGGIKRNEVATVLMDVITTPAEVSIGAEVKRRVNHIVAIRWSRLRWRLILVRAISCKRRTCWQAQSVIFASPNPRRVLPPCLRGSLRNVWPSRCECPTSGISAQGG